jgi:hypothetical protein
MAFTQGLRRPDEVRGPQWRQPQLNGVSMAGVAIAGVHPLAGLGEQRHRTAATINAPCGAS